MSYLFAFSYCSWGLKARILKWFAIPFSNGPHFVRTPPWPVRLGWSYMAWLSFIQLDKAVFHMLGLVSFLWLWFQSVCPLMPSLSTYHLTAVSLTLDVGYPFTAAPAKQSCCSLPWMWGISFWLLAPPEPHSRTAFSFTRFSWSRFQHHKFINDILQTYRIFGIKVWKTSLVHIELYYLLLFTVFLSSEKSKTRLSWLYLLLITSFLKALLLCDILILISISVSVVYEKSAWISVLMYITYHWFSKII